MKKKDSKNPANFETISGMIENLASSTARGFEEIHKEIKSFEVVVHERFDKAEKDASELKESVKATRQSILEVGDRFVQRHEFENLLIRVNRLEGKLKRN